MPQQAVPLVRALADELVARQPDELEVRRRASRLAAFCLAMMLWVPVFAIIYTALGAPTSSTIILSGGTILLGILLLLRRGYDPDVCGNLLAAAAWYVYTALAALTGGLFAPVMVWFATLPILAVLVSGNRSGAFWTVFAVLTVGGFALALHVGVRFPVEVSPHGLRVLQASGLMGLLTCVFLLVSVLKSMEFGARQALRAANSMLEQQALTDGLTGIPNRHCFDRLLEQEWSRHSRAGLPLSMALIDADFFKAFNDEYGHLAGDDCLREVACAIQDSLSRPEDFCARYGGEEFVIILPNTDDDGARRVAELIRTQVRTLRIPHSRSAVGPHVSISIGVSTTIPRHGDSHHDFLYEVDMALYRAKKQGRNCIAQALFGVEEPVL